MDEDEIVERVKAAELERQRAIAEHKIAVEELREAIIEARDAGISMLSLSRDTGIGRSSLYQVLRVGGYDFGAE